MPRKDTLRGCIVMKWKASGSSAMVPYDQVLEWAKDCDHDFRRRGLNPAPVFRNYLESGDERLKTYVKGERFQFRIVDEPMSIGGIRQSAPPLGTPIASDTARRACLKCGRLNLVDAVYCSYCRQPMPRGPAEEALNWQIRVQQ
jgi:hypothetical protein